MKNLMTAEQAFNVAMNEHALLYASATVEQARLKFYDQTFNVLGNGINSMEDFVKSYHITKKNTKYLDSFPAKYIGNHELYLVFAEREGRIDTGSGSSELYTKEELAELGNPRYIDNIAEDFGRYEFVPYPNFRKEYSLIGVLDFAELDVSWTQAAIEFYSQAKAFFQSDKVKNYHHHFPEPGETKESCVADYTEMFDRIGKGKKEQDFYQYITQQYGFGVEYTGNVEQFLEKRWHHRQAEANRFIDETLEYLNHLLEQKQGLQHKPGKI
jgi:hypothetical protein